MSALMVKLIGGVMIVLSAFSISRKKCDSLRMRVKFIDGLIAGFVSLEEHICGMLVPVEEALILAACDAGEAESVFLTAASSDGGMKERFGEAFSKNNNEDMGAVINFSSGICSSDDNERRTSFSLIRSRLSGLRADAEGDCNRLCRLYNAAGVLGGLVIVILLF